MTTIGLRELRQQASDLLRRVEGGEQVLITVAGRPSARLVPVRPRAWQSWTEVADVFDGPADPQWDTDRDRLDGELLDPWDRAR
ncbi:type II toxin-antitoxin system prevent-host-death family antitoxin [Aquipuribacter nitratireducens]|uniref:Antitoxin n=1 Tax=Aquipuribacter nitratireducens TaxID=650104 RepID=A0ABW0GJ31_9MICO